jgi:hypothetical protein
MHDAIRRWPLVATGTINARRDRKARATVCHV